MAFSSIPYSEEILTLTPAAWQRVGTVCPALKHREVNITYNTKIADTVSLHIGVAAPTGLQAPNLRNQYPVDSDGGVQMNPYLVLSGASLWIKTIMGNGAVLVQGFEEES
jgi:hypothetical protein